MKRVRTLLPLALLTLVIGLSGCTALDRGIVTIVPSTFHLGETVTISFSFRSYEPATVTVSSIDCEFYLDGVFLGKGTLDPGHPWWKTGTVPPFQEVVIWSQTGPWRDGIGNWELRVVFHTSEGDFPARGEWTVLP